MRQRTTIRLARQGAILVAIAATIMAAGAAAHRAAAADARRGPYLGERPPGVHPVPFAPDILTIPGKNHHTISFSPDGRELYFSRYPEHITLVMHEVGGRWTAPEPVSWKGWEAVFSPDGGRLIFGDGDLWTIGRGAAGWNEPRKLPAPVNSSEHDYYASMTAGGTLYFSRTIDRRPAIFRSRPEGGQYRSITEVLGNAYHPFVSPDETYLLFNSFGCPDGMGAADLYIAFFRGDGSLSAPVNLGPEINTPDSDLCPVVTPDGRYLFFTRLREGTGRPYWVSMEALAPLKRIRLDPARGLAYTVKASIGCEK